MEASHVTRRALIARGAVAAAALTVAGRASDATAQMPAPTEADGLLQAFYDTIIPGRRTPRTDLGHPIHPRAIAGADGLPGAVECDALAVGRHPLAGFAVLEPVLIVELTRATAIGGGLDGTFLDLPYDRREAVCVAGLDFANPLRLIWEAGAAIAFAAVAGGLAPEQTAARSSGYRVLGHPGVAPDGYRRFSYREPLAKGRTRGRGSLP